VEDTHIKSYRIVSSKYDLQPFVNDTLKLEKTILLENIELNWIPATYRVNEILNDDPDQLQGYRKFVYDNRDNWDKVRNHVEFLLLEEESKNVIDIFNICHRIEYVIKETLESPNFHKFIEILLAVGNTLNQETSKAFFLDILFELDTITSSNNKSVLQYCKDLYKNLYPNTTILPQFHEPKIPEWDWLFLKENVRSFTSRVDKLKKLKDDPNYKELNGKIANFDHLTPINDIEFMKLFSKYFSSKNSRFIVTVYELFNGHNPLLKI